MSRKDEANAAEAHSFRGYPDWTQSGLIHHTGLTELFSCFSTETAEPQSISPQTTAASLRNQFGPWTGLHSVRFTSNVPSQRLAPSTNLTGSEHKTEICQLRIFDLGHNSTYVCSSSVTKAGESNSFVRWAGDFDWAWSSTVQERRFWSFTVVLCSLCRSFPVFTQRPLVDQRRPTSKLSTDHFCILLVKVSFTHCRPDLIGPYRLGGFHFQFAWTQTGSIHQSDGVWM